jgi:DNA-binding PadR family transcriptional regulator
VSPVFGHGDLRLYLLHSLDEKPQHGYELIRLLEDRFVGLYSPSAGTIYPRLAALEEDGLIEHYEEEGRKVYRITDAGREELHDRREEMRELEAKVVTSVRDLARDIREDVRASVRDLRREIKDSARQIRREERRHGQTREVRIKIARDHDLNIDHEFDRAHEHDREHRERNNEWRDELRSIKGDLEAFVNDVLAAARRRDLDGDRIRRLRRVLLDARAAVLDALLDPPQTATEPADESPER